MSKHAIAYVQGLQLADPTVERVLLLLAERTNTWNQERPVMGLELRDADIPRPAVEAKMSAQEFRHLPRTMKNTVRMDVLEHSDGVWEIVYGPSCTGRAPTAAAQPADAPIGAIQAFTMPGWDHYSTWGYDASLGHLYAPTLTWCPGGSSSSHRAALSCSYWASPTLPCSTWRPFPKVSNSSTRRLLP
ncbi:hypothetical protein [Streptosporangium sp. NPDC049376]|uniref:hypothetical protein n=1 Tax=Streptosporangium sp. NPDC049376 TaxID=3366192 RepID=UPI003788CB2D